MPVSSLSVLRQFVPPRELLERCDSCGTELAADHEHTFEPASRRIRCACSRCLSFMPATLQRIPRDVRILSGFHISDFQWDILQIPISLAFFSYSTPAEKWIALYPGPAGAAESLLRIELWRDIASANPQLSNIKADVEALLVNRVGAARDYFIVPIDECYKLVGLIRIHWRGLSGGGLVWGEIGRFFDRLRQKGLVC